MLMVVEHLQIKQIMKTSINPCAQYPKTKSIVFKEWLMRDIILEGLGDWWPP